MSTFAYLSNISQLQVEHEYLDKFLREMIVRHHHLPQKLLHVCTEYVILSARDDLINVNER